ncbi:MAG: tRNA (adenosine(37)-N6)-threonylcarbamoyltransferase complex transferase subunit TsaD [Nitrospinae bacterium]|nr:tRNA (adenosine(37)-N6)-threonylcarbamoyltransferase complex transferase subunit TsaD [Nitrospinota bacterium]
MLILGIETSCDETSASVVEDGINIRSNIIASQVDIHKKYGGVVPELASRRHVENINIVINQSLEEGRVSLNDIDAISVTVGPGLVGALLVGLSVAKGIAYAKGVPLIGVNHLEGHILSIFIERPQIEFPFMALIVSGGHTDLYLVHRVGDYHLLGRTRDDAAGESFDKVANMLGLWYPGGPIIEKIAEGRDPKRLDFPRAYLGKDSLDFSFSGVKTSVRNYLKEKGIPRDGDGSPSIGDISASFQEAVIDVLTSKVIKASKIEGVKTIVIAGGVASNKRLRMRITETGEKEGLKVYYPSPLLCTDNAAMIACAGYYRYIDDKRLCYDLLNMDAEPNMRLG